MKRLTALILTMLLVSTIVLPIHASNEITLSQEDTKTYCQKIAAKNLHELGLFQGTRIDQHGKPVFDLDKIPTRAQATIMLVRLLGKENEAKTNNWEVPFTDVSESLKPYVGYVYKIGISKGKTATTYGSNDIITAPQYITFVLRALGYDSSSDFTIKRACKFANEIELTFTEYTNYPTNFNRGDVAQLSYNALNTNIKDSSQSLGQTLGVHSLSYKYFESIFNLEQIILTKEEQRRHKGEIGFTAIYNGTLTKDEFKKRWLNLDEGLLRNNIEHFTHKVRTENPNLEIGIGFNLDSERLASVFSGLSPNEKAAYIGLN